MKMYFVRHGETDYNTADRISGQVDIPLTAAGIEQARRLRDELPEDVTVIYSSDLIRCKQTTDILNEGRNLPVVYDPRLRERAAGSLEGKEWAVVDPNGEMKKMNTSLRYDFRPYGGESVEGVSARIVECIRDIRDHARGGVPLVVTSAGVIRLVHQLVHNEIRERVHNSSIHEFDLA